MMRSKTIGICIGFILIIVLAWLVVGLKRGVYGPMQPVTTQIASSTSASDTSAEASSTAANTGDTLEVMAPRPNATITSPLTIRGQAVSSWYFEGQFPVELVEEDGTVLAQGTAQANADWTGSGFIPFSAELPFPPATSTTIGLLILKKDNPSGDPSRDTIFAIPVRFK